MVLVAGLAMLLLWRVYMHHLQAEPFVERNEKLVQIESNIFSRGELNYSKLENLDSGMRGAIS